MRGDFAGSLKAFENVSAIARDQPPADEAVYHIGLVYAHPQNAKRDRKKAIVSFSRIISCFPESPWAEQARIWVSVLSEAEASKQEIERSKQIIETSNQEIERSRQEMEKSKLDAEKSRLELEKARQMIERSRQVDMEIEQKRRERGR